MLMEALVEFLEAVEGNFQQGPPPAIDLRTPQRIVDDLPVRKILQVPSVDNGQQPECYICLSLFEQGEDARRLPCGHEFHVACIDRWLLDVHRTCPCCRSDICAMAGSGSAQAEEKSEGGGDEEGEGGRAGGAEGGERGERGFSASNLLLREQAYRVAHRARVREDVETRRQGTLSPDSNPPAAPTAVSPASAAPRQGAVAGAPERSGVAVRGEPSAGYRSGGRAVSGEPMGVSTTGLSPPVGAQAERAVASSGGEAGRGHVGSSAGAEGGGAGSSRGLQQSSERGRVPEQASVAPAAAALQSLPPRRTEPPSAPPSRRLQPSRSCCVS